MDNTQKEQQITTYKNTLNTIVLKIQQNELDVGNSVQMTSPPYIVRQELTLLRRNAWIFIAKELPGITKKQNDSRVLYNLDEFKIAGVAISKSDGLHLSGLRWELQDAIKLTIERFNQHLINLRPNYYPNRTKAIYI